MARPPKKSAGKKTDTAGTQKKARWTPDQKAAAKKLKAAGGPKKPHRKGGSPSGPAREERREPREYQKREDRPYRGRDDRPRGERSEYRSRDDRGGDRREYRARDDRGDYRQRDDRSDYRGRDERRDYRGRDDRADYRQRDDRRDFRGRDDRGDYRQRDDRRDFRARDDRRDYRQRDDRSGYQGRDDRSGYRGRDDRPYRSDRADRPYREDRDDRARTGRSDDRRRDDRPYRNDRARDDRGDYRQRDDRRRDDRADAPPTWEEAEAERAEADTYVRYSGARASGPAKVTDDNGFAAMGLPMVLVERLARDGITEPFAIQSTTIPDALAGRDVLGRAQTGSGKTLGFGLPLLTRLMGSKSRPKRPRAIVLVPTRELAMQVNDALEPLAVASGLRCRLVAGGLSYTGQISALDRGVDVLIATPGRLKDLREREAVDFSAVEVTVLDEADHMADMGFMVDVSTILDEIPTDGQRLLFSATLDNGVDQVVERYLTDPVEHGVDDVGASVETMSHFVFLVGPQDKKTVTAELANRTTRTIVFVRTKLGADRVASELQDRGVRAAALHGGLTQSVRNRVLGAFREGHLPVLVATDVAARGIHVDDVSLVLQVDPPADHKDYLHRSGRTARAGELGTVVTIALPHQRRTMERMVAAAGLDISPVAVRPGDALIDAAGGSPPSGHSVADEVAAVLAPKQRGHRRGHPARTPGGGGRPRFGKGGRSGDRRPPRQDRRGDR
ncbi:MAG: DEAD/DEAH box helicase [Dermatophilaceae bacterium]